MNGYERILSVLEGRDADSLPYMPITMMFAADQLGIKYGEYASDYKKLVEAQLLTAERFDFDYVSVISDPAREATDCGACVHLYEDHPPSLDENNSLLREKSMLKGLEIPDPLAGGRMLDRVRAAELFAKQVKGELLIEGWIEGPMAESADLRGINTIMMDFFTDPAFVRDMFEFSVEMGLRFGKAQVDAGVDIIGLGDAAASLIGPELYREFVLPYEKRLIDGLHEMGTKVRLHICGNTSQMLDDIGTLGADFVDLDSQAPIAQARAAMGPDQVFTGNIDPVAVLRNGTPELIHEELAKCADAAGRAYVVAAGCEVPRDTPLENLNAMRDFAKSRTPS
jgi:MtaA/CmuA family methyltransferase